MVFSKDATHSVGEGWSFEQMGQVEPDVHMQKNEVGPLPHAIHRE